MDKNEIVVISGKGGTGKTTILLSMLPYFEELVIADCDVDAPDLKVIIEKEIIYTEKFVGLKKAVIDKSLCINCGKCFTVCKFNAIDEKINLKQSKCEGCGICAYVCINGAIEMKDTVIGDLYISNTKYGMMVDAELIPGEEASGKLVSKVRKEAMKIAKDKNIKNILVDGSPGIACNVISSIAGANKVIIVTESTEAGIHDLKRVYELVKKFNLKTFIVVNKYDLCIENYMKLKNFCELNKISIDLKIPFNRKIVESLIKKEIASESLKEFFKEIKFEKFIGKIKE